MQTARKNTFFLIGLIFFISGIPGLICEIIWAHYLQIAFGGAFFGQLLSIGIYMAGLAAGSLISSFFIRSRSILLIAAIAEWGFGLFSWFYHPIFLELNTGIFIAALTFLPALLSGLALPILHEYVRHSLKKKFTASLGILYALNTLGAFVGILISESYLKNHWTLPEILQATALISAGTGLGFFILHFSRKNQPVSLKSKTFPIKPGLLLKAIFFAFFSGWMMFSLESLLLRMISIVNGSSVFSLSAMLAAIILGLAAGSGISIQFQSKKPELIRLRNAWALMTFVIILSWWAYTFSFDLLYYFLRSTAQTSQKMILSAFLISMLLGVIPAMVSGYLFPQYTRMFRIGGLQKASSISLFLNILGGICGMFATYILLPVLSIKTIFLFQAVLALLMIFISTAGHFPGKKQSSILLSIVFTLLLLGTFIFSDVNSSVAASGVFRGGYEHRDNLVLFHKDGKTATVDVFISKNRLKTLSINGKPDAAISLTETAGPDEPTMNLLGLLPFAYRPQAEKALVIGLGMGITSRNILYSNSIKEVQTLEIEPAISDAAMTLGSVNQLVFADNRSKITFADARQFLNKPKDSFDIIVSEPSNPWVKGNSNLFTVEFYKTVRQSLQKKGVFVQWIHLYENSNNLVYSIIKSIDFIFSDYDIYFADNANLILIASKDTLPTADFTSLFANASMAKALNRISINGPQNLKFRIMGNKKSLQNSLQKDAYKLRSDFNLSFEYQAAEAFYKRSFAEDFSHLRKEYFIDHEPMGNSNTQDNIISPELYFRPAYEAYQCILLANQKDSTENGTNDLLLNQHLSTLKNSKDRDKRINALCFIMSYTLPNTFIAGLKEQLLQFLKDDSRDDQQIRLFKKLNIELINKKFQAAEKTKHTLLEMKYLNHSIKRFLKQEVQRSPTESIESTQKTDASASSILEE